MPKKLLNVLLAIPDRLKNPMGGMGESVRNLMDSLESGNYPVSVNIIATGESGDYTYNKVAKVYAASSVNNRQYPMDMNGFVSSTLLSTPITAACARVVREEFPNVLHFQDFPTFLSGISLRDSLKVPLVAHVQLSVTHAYTVSDSSVVEKNQQNLCSWIQSEGILHADRVVVVSKYYGNLVVPVVKRNFTSVLVNGVKKFSSDAREDDFFLPGRKGKRIGYLGRFASMKNVMEAVNGVPDEYDILLCGPDEGGDAGIKDNLKILSKTKKNVFLLKAKYGEEKNHFLKYCDFGIFPSSHEPFGIAGLEWMSAGTPLIASGIGGMTEYLRKENHIRCGTTDKSIHSAINSIKHTDIGLIVKNGLKTAEQFSWEKAAEDYFNLWLNLCIDHRRSGCLQKGY